MHTEETFSALSERAMEVVRNCNWQVYHTPENLVLFLLSEAAELGENCQWLTRKGIEQVGMAGAVSEELSDVIKNVLYLANVIPLPDYLDLETLIVGKLKLDDKKYPPEEYRGRSKYDAGIRQELVRPETFPLREDRLPYTPSIADLQSMAWRFVEDREWQQFYSPAKLALAIAVKSGQVATCYQRRPAPIESAYERVVWALADILLNALRLSEFMGIQTTFEIVREKLDKDERRFRSLPEREDEKTLRGELQSATETVFARLWDNKEDEVWNEYL